MLTKAGIRTNKGQYILDVGCGDGGDCEFLSENAPAIVVGIDIELNPDWTNTKRGNLHFAVTDACQLPFPNEAFVIICEKRRLRQANQSSALLE